MKLWLQNNDIEMYSTHNKRKSVVTARFIRILKNNIYKYMKPDNKSDNTVNKYNNTYCSTIKMKPVDAKFSTYLDFDKK